MAEYQVGDRVRIVSEWNNECHQNPEGLMDHWLGATMTIKSWNGGAYQMEEDVGERGEGYGWNWFPAAIAGPAVNAEKYRIYKNSILIDIVPDGTCLYIYTTSRNHGRKCFIVLNQSLKDWLMGEKKTFVDKDFCGFLYMYIQKKVCHVTITWLNGNDSNLTGYNQSFTIPLWKIKKAVIYGKKSQHLSYDWRGTTKVQLECDHAYMSSITENKRLKRAFSKAMRDCFQWGEDTIYLYKDWAPHSFFFKTASGWPSCGGLILHSSEITTPCGKQKSYLYSTHT